MKSRAIGIFNLKFTIRSELCYNFKIINIYIGNKKMKKNFLYLSVILPILALISPLILLPIEKIIPYPHIVEEIIKAIFVLLILLIPGRLFQFKLAVFIGFLFALSENVFYLTNGLLYESPLIFLERILAVSFFHILTLSIILFFGQKKRWLIIPALVIAILIHYFYNQIISAF